MWLVIYITSVIVVIVFLLQISDVFMKQPPPFA